MWYIWIDGQIGGVGGDALSMPWMPEVFINNITGWVRQFYVFQAAD